MNDNEPTVMTFRGCILILQQELEMKEIQYREWAAAKNTNRDYYAGKADAYAYAHKKIQDAINWIPNKGAEGSEPMREHWNYKMASVYDDAGKSIAECTSYSIARQIAYDHNVLQSAPVVQTESQEQLWNAVLAIAMSGKSYKRNEVIKAINQAKAALSKYQKP